MNIRLSLAIASTLLPAALAAAPSNQAQQCLAEPPTLEALTPEFRERMNTARKRLSELSASQSTATPTETGQQLASKFGSLGQLYHAHLLFGLADACYRAALELQPNDYRAYYYLAYLHQQQSKISDAAAAYEQALRLNPKLAQAALRLALIRIDQGDDREALDLLNAWRNDPELGAWALFQLGRRALASGHYQQAADLLSQALTLDPAASRIHYPLAMAWRGLGDRQRAREHLSQRGEHEPGFPDPLVESLSEQLPEQRTQYRLAMAAVKARDYPAAVAAFRAGLANDPDNLNARISLARALYLGDDVNTASQQLQQVIEQTPHPLAIFLFGILMDHQGRYTEAEALYRRTLTLDPNHGGAHFYLANRLLVRGEFGTAAAHYRSAWQQVPDNTPARLREVLASAYAGASEQQTLTALEQLHSAHPSAPSIGYYLTRVLTLASERSLRDPQRAESLAMTLYGEYPGPNQAELVALVAAAKGEYPNAERWIQQTIDGAQQAGPAILKQLYDIRARYQQRLPSTESPLGEPLIPPPVDIRGVFQGYPSKNPY